jgi:hypothetical protein
VFAQALGDDVGAATEAAVTWASQAGGYSWTGSVGHLARYDEATRTARLVIEIADVDNGIATQSAPWPHQPSTGMFCQVKIPIEPVQDALVVPRTIINEDNTVYVFEPGAAAPDGGLDRLALRHVRILRKAGDDVLVGSASRNEDGHRHGSGSEAIRELQAGELLVISPPPRPVVGMKLRGRTTALTTGRMRSDDVFVGRQVDPTRGHALLGSPGCQSPAPRGTGELAPIPRRL